MPHFRLFGTVAAIVALLASLIATPAGASKANRVTAQKGPDDVVVVAVIDSAINPYHWDFLADKMPQATDSDPTNDLPLHRPPHEWLPGFPNPKKAFKRYEALRLTLEKRNKDAPLPGLVARDQKKIAKVKLSTEEELNYYWIPDTKVIGAMRFTDDPLVGQSNEHGVGVTSVSTGNIHGTCPECVLFFINLGAAAEAEAAIAWAMDQPWIDVITNSYGHGGRVPKIYNGTTVEDQREASERGQTVFFSAGNGFENAFTVTNPTYMSSQKGPDWLITVGAVSPGPDNTYNRANRGSSEHASYLGAGKPVDVASLGLDYPSAYNATTVSSTGTSGFGGTSNAAPTIAGTYARALYLARRDLAGPSRIQRNDVIAKGARYDCGRVRPKCELGDGVLTATELRTRLLHGAIHTPAGMTTYGHGAHTPPIGEDEFLNEGHGTYFAREARDDKAWLEEFDRILGPLQGRAKTLERPDGELEWMIVDSYCRQSIWGAWGGGYYVEGETQLPGPDPLRPIRTMMAQDCAYLQPPP